MYSIRRILIFCALIFLILPAFSQDRKSADDYLMLAEEVLKATQALDQAREMLITAADADTTYAKANYLAAEIHLNTIYKERAVTYLLRVLRQNPNYRFDLEFHIGRSYHFGLQFDKAIEYFERYKRKLVEKPNYQGRDRVPLGLVERKILECQNGKRMVANPGNFSIVNIGREINSESDDYAPVLNEREDELVFTSRRRDDNLNPDVSTDNKPFEDIFITTKVDGKWTYAKNINAPINTPYHNSNLALSADGKVLLIYDDEIGDGDIMMSERQADGVWSEPKPLPGIINSSYQENGASLSKDGKTMFFTSNRPGGEGNHDIYMATKDSKGQWSKVKNLGPKINTELDEEGPFIDYDGVTLFFSSEGHEEGMGGHDVFKTTLDPKTGEWSDPVNLGYPINTPDHDLYFVASHDSKRAYYSSFREDGLGYQDIYMITIPEGLKNPQPVVAEIPPKKPEKKDTVATVVTRIEPKKEPEKEPVKQPDPPKKSIVPLRYVVTVVDAEGKKPLNATVKLQGAKDNVIVKSTSNNPGVIEFAITSTTAKDYRLSVEMDGYVFRNENIRIQPATTEEKTLTRTVDLRKISVGVTSILRNLYFDFDRATFKTESYTELNKLENMLRQNSSLKIEIGGHTDAVGSYNYNVFLSRKRAEAVKDYLTKKGIDPRRISAKGYGKSKPLASNDDENDGRELNRRVEFKVLRN
jgi:outer membrane protein OmpA-like peptidoglycan-associated protein